MTVAIELLSWWLGNSQQKRPAGPDPRSPSGAGSSHRSSPAPPPRGHYTAPDSEIPTKGTVIGAKPAAFAYWMFRLLGARIGDTLDDLYPGSGGIARAWDHYQQDQPA